MESKRRRMLRVFMHSSVFTLLVTVAVGTSFKSAVADWYEVPTGSMKPTILEGDRILVNKLAYDLKVPYTTIHLATWDDPKRGDIVIFSSPADGRRLVKRVIGIPGDTLTMLDNHLLINGRPLGYSLLPSETMERIPAELRKNVLFNENLSGHKHPVMITPSARSLHTFGPVVVPDGHYFVMGDNRDNSGDSRYFGFVERRSVVGRATAVVISLNYENHHLPRWERSFTHLP